MVSIGQSFSVIAYGKMEKYLFTNNRKYMFFLYIEFNNTGIDIGFYRHHLGFSISPKNKHFVNHHPRHILAMLACNWLNVNSLKN
jgi:hypothetical protein